MNPKITVVRAIGSMMLQDVLRIITIITGIILAGLLVLAWWLTANVSPWWGMLLAFIVLLIILAFALRFIAMWVLKHLYPLPLTKAQRTHTRNFIDKVQSIAAVRSLGWPMFIAQTIGDLLRYRDVTSLRKLASDSSTLRDELSELEKLFEKRT